MKSRGIVRKTDDLGRVVLPIEFRRMLGIKDNMEVEMIATEDGILVKKAIHICSCCGEKHDLYEFNGAHVCNYCLDGFIRVASNG